MPPLSLSTAFNCSCAWSWLRAANTFAVLLNNMDHGHITDIYTRPLVCTEDSQPALYCGSDPSSKNTQFQHACPSPPTLPPHPTPLHPTPITLLSFTKGDIKTKIMEGTGCFPLLFPNINSDWFSSLYFVEWYDSSILPSFNMHRGCLYVPFTHPIGRKQNREPATNTCWSVLPWCTRPRRIPTWQCIYFA